MNRRTTLTLTVLLFLAVLFATAAPKIGLAQSNPLIATWKLNLGKSKAAGPPPMNMTQTFAGEGKNLTNTVETIDALGRVSTVLYVHIYDGKPHPTTGNPNYDSTAYTRVDTNTVNFVRFREGKTAETGQIVVSADGKTYTSSAEGTAANGQQYNYVLVFDRQ